MRNHRLVQKAREANPENPIGHLAASTPDKPQDPNAKCPSGHARAIQCCCEESSISARLAPKLGPNLVVVPANLIDQWKNDFRKLFGQGEQLTMGMKLTIVWYKASSPNCRQYDTWDAVKQRILVDQETWLPTPGQERYIVLTGTNQKTYKETFVSQMWRFVLKNPAEAAEGEVLTDEGPIHEIELNGICWGSITVDEFHLCKSVQNSLMIDLEKFNNWFIDYSHLPNDRRPPVNPNSRPHKWGLSGTPWEKSPADMLAFLKALFSPAWDKKDSPYFDLRPDAITDLAKRHSKIVKQVTEDKSMTFDDPAVHQIIDILKNLFPKFMIRRTDDSEMFNRRVVDLPPLEVTWVPFTTPSDLKDRIADYRKSVASREKAAHKKALAVWAKVNRNKSPAQQAPKPLAPNDSNRTHSPNHVLRVLADFPYLINYVYDNGGVEIESCFTLKDIKTRKDVFLSHLREILDSSPKYEHLLSIFEGRAQGNYQPQDKLVIGSAHPMTVFLVKSVCLPSLTNKDH